MEVILNEEKIREIVKESLIDIIRGAQVMNKRFNSLDSLLDYCKMEDDKLLISFEYDLRESVHIERAEYRLEHDEVIIRYKISGGEWLTNIMAKYRNKLNLEAKEIGNNEYIITIYPM